MAASLQKQNTMPTSGARKNAAQIKSSLDDVIRRVRDNITKVEEPKAQALFETAAEVLTGLRTAFDHYETQSEPAMTAVTGGAPAGARSPRQENL
ncbi:MAG TPA: hypothetical protein VFV83_00610 [Chthoniobacteraceae bacterium]|nr:hypothetical protein [Chthoniobacteraceae bacterium]